MQNKWGYFYEIKKNLALKFLVKQYSYVGLINKKSRILQTYKLDETLKSIWLKYFVYIIL